MQYVKYTSSMKSILKEIIIALSIIGLIMSCFMSNILNFNIRILSLKNINQEIVDTKFLGKVLVPLIYRRCK